MREWKRLEWNSEESRKELRAIHTKYIRSMILTCIPPFTKHAITAELHCPSETLLDGALETVRDTEQTAIDIADELGRNRETIGSIRGHVADAGGDLGAARGLIGRMQRREVQQKAVLTVVAAILIAAIGTVSYYSFS